MSKADEPLSSRVLAAFLEGEVTRSEAAQIEAKLRGCEISRRRLARLTELRDALSAVPDELTEIDLRAGVRNAIDGRGVYPAGSAAEGQRGSIDARPVGRTRAAHSIWWGTAGLLGTAAVLALVLRTRGAEISEPFREKAAGTTANTHDQWVAIEVFRVDAGGHARPVEMDAVVQPTDGLVFRYNNVGRAPFHYVMVFGVDVVGELHWYYPAYEVPGDDPRSVTIRPGGAVPLPDAVRNEVPPGPLTIYGVFSQAPLRVLEIERQVAALIAQHGWDSNAPPRLPIASSGQDVIRLNVSR